MNVLHDKDAIIIVVSKNLSELMEIRAWCIEKFNRNRWNFDHNKFVKNRIKMFKRINTIAPSFNYKTKFYFKYDKDALLFKLTWL